MSRNIFTIPFGKSFLKTFVNGFYKTFTDPLTIANTVILLPTNRGCQLMQKALRAHAGNTILPKIIPLTDTGALKNLYGGVMDADEQAIISPILRVGLLSQLIQKHHKLSAQQSVHLAKSLLDFIDEVWVTGLDFSNLKKIINDDYAEHWKVTLDFLEIITDFWPKILEEMKVWEAQKRRHQNMMEIADIIANATDHPNIIIAGTTGSVPATQHIIKAVLGTENGKLVLPGFDPTLTPPISLTNPQYTMLTLLDFLSVPPQEVQLWVNEKPTLRHQMINAVITSPIVAPSESAQLPTFIEAKNQQDESRAISLIVRDHLRKNPDCKIAIITGDQALTEQITLGLRHFGIIANTSAGQKFSTSVVGSYLRLIATYLTKPDDGILLSLLKNPLAAKDNRGLHLKSIRYFERSLCRSQRKFPFPKTLQDIDVLAHIDDIEIQNYLDQLFRKMINITETAKDFASTLKALIQIAQTICGDEAFFREQDGKAALIFLDEISRTAYAYRHVKKSEFESVFAQVLDHAPMLRDEQSLQENVMVLGTLEARLLNADVVILAGLNEKSWPPATKPDCWLSPSMRVAFGLPAYERRVGLSTHDFCSCFITDDIYLTRSQIQEGSPTIPSRLWQRFMTYKTLVNEEPSDKPDYLNLVKHIFSTSPAPIIIAPPVPTPPAAARPVRFSVSDIESLRRDPYRLYAKSVLRLRPLDPFIQSPTAADRGNLYHKVLELFVKEQAYTTPSPDAFKEIGKTVFGGSKFSLFTLHIWQTQFDNITPWLSDSFVDSHIKHAYAEVKLEKEFTIRDHPVIVFGIADRIDDTDQAHRIVDYKTGGTPTKRDIEDGYAPQLQILGLLLGRGEPELAYWVLKGRVDDCVVQPIDLIDIEKQLMHLLETYAANEMPYRACPDPKHAPAINPYAHLERIAEWGRQ